MLTGLPAHLHTLPGQDDAPTSFWITVYDSTNCSAYEVFQFCLMYSSLLSTNATITSFLWQ